MKLQPLSQRYIALGLAMLCASACSSTSRGAERGACYASNTCDPGLTCASSVCVRLNAGDASDVPPADTVVADAMVVDVTTTAETGSDAQPDVSMTPDAVADVVTAMNPTVSIYHPSDMDPSRTARMDIPFAGAATDSRGAALTGTALVWTDSVSGPMGAGAMLFYRLSEGMHTITLTATDSAGLMGSASIRLNIAP